MTSSTKLSVFALILLLAWLFMVSRLANLANEMLQTQVPEKATVEQDGPSPFKVGQCLIETRPHYGDVTALEEWERPDLYMLKILRVGQQSYEVDNWEFINGNANKKVFLGTTVLTKKAVHILFVPMECPK